jgi:hypothetical protein
MSKSMTRSGQIPVFFLQEVPLDNGVQALAEDQERVQEGQRDFVARESGGVAREVHQQRTIRVSRANGTVWKHALLAPG